MEPSLIEARLKTGHPPATSSARRWAMLWDARRHRWHAGRSTCTGSG